ELMRQRTTPAPEPVADWPAINPADPFDLFETGMRALGEGPLGEADRLVLEGLAPLKLRPGRKFDVRGFREVEREAVKRGIARSRDEIRAAARQAGPTVNGWSYPKRSLGNFGDDYLYRAVI